MQLQFPPNTPMNTVRRWAQENVAKISANIAKKEIEMETLLKQAQQTKENTQKIVQNSVTRYLGTSKEKVRHSLKETGMGGAKQLDSDDDSEDEEDKVSEKDRELSQNVQLIVHVERFKELLTNWPDRNKTFGFDLILDWRSRMENYLMQSQRGRQLVLKHTTENIRFGEYKITKTHV